ncbi:MAG: biotin carboxylase N-terminal domain-containing protein [Limnobacter sp.]|nr:biotin carboxylase N-terminal domain-containing protein [Limnobacter sp.]
MFKKILIANRGEIARRIHRTAQRMGVQTVGIFSDPDAHALHVQECDQAVALGGTQASDTYLNIDKVIAAAKATGAQAIHPGYGFLSENPAFAQACDQAGLVFIGPSHAAIEVMGSKSKAKACVQGAGVPLIPGYFGEDQSLDTLRQEAAKIGYPVMLKAVAGGGGKGIRAVASESEFASALESCQREAKNAFGDAAVMIEKLIVNPRHVEVQVFADTHGNVVHLFERDCSAQRRHQKVIEEAPAFGLTDAQRQAMGQTAIDVAKAVNYVGAGTVEFLLDARGDYFFMEMNTRLQVEHPVTEMVTGFDLVEWQLRVAAGEPLPVDQNHIHLSGHALEVRLYAENPAKGFLPAIGQIVLWEGADALNSGQCAEFAVELDGQQTQAFRLDGAVQTGSEISPHYDPMIGKLITWGSTREESRQAMLAALARLRCVGVQTNLQWLSDLCNHPDFTKGGYDTGVIDRMTQAEMPQAPAIPQGDLAALCGLASWARQAAASVQHEANNPNDPLSMLDGFTATSRVLRQDDWSIQDTTFQTHTHVRLNKGAAVVSGRAGHAVTGQAVESGLSLFPGVTVDETGLVRCQGMLGEQCFDLIWHADELHVHLGYEQCHLIWSNPASLAADAADASHGVAAPMPGKIFAVHVKPGQIVNKGDPLIGLEAMKMEHTLTSPVDAKVASVPHQVGEQVLEGTDLIVFEEE